MPRAPYRGGHGGARYPRPCPSRFWAWGTPSYPQASLALGKGLRAAEACPKGGAHPVIHRVVWVVENWGCAPRVGHGYPPVTCMLSDMTSFARDLTERVAKTFVQAFFATFAATFAVPADFNVDNWQAAAVSALVAAIAAGLSAVSSVLSRPFGDPGTASVVSSVSPGSAEDQRA